MRWSAAIRSGHRRRGIGHDRGLIEPRLIRAAIAAALAAVLGGCATAPPRPVAPISLPAPLAAVDAPAPAVSGPRGRLIDGALSMLGQPYRWGGSAPGGFDCSGLVVYAAAGAGIQLPREAKEQARQGTPVQRRDLGPGDLVFMHLKHKELHVGIFLGAQRFVHAPSSGGHVRIDSLAAAPYSESFVGARRIVKDPT